MAITLLTPAAKLAPVPSAGNDLSAADAGSADLAGASLAGNDFSKLLLGQLAPQAPGTSISLPADAGTKDDGEQAVPLVAEQDPGAAAAQILASLGLTKPDVSAEKGTVKTDITAEASSKGQTIQGLAASQIAAGSAEGKSNEAMQQPLAPATSMENSNTQSINAKPAKFAEVLDAATSPASVASIEGRDSPTPTAPTVQPMHADRPQTIARHDAVLEIQTPVRDVRWNQDFTQKIVWLAGNGKQSAELTLNPPQMGPIEIALNIDKGSASATFVSANADVRQSIESALPRLREMFAGLGIELGQANVSAESFRQAQGGQANEGQSQGNGQGRQGQAILVTESMSLPSTHAMASSRGNSMVDIFA